MRSESQFIDAVDCCFPYGEEALAHGLIDEACAISANAAFMVVHELARRPKSSSAGDETCLALVTRVQERFEHPVRDAVLAAARRMIRGECLPTTECVELMREIAHHRGQFHALAVAYFSCEDAGMETVGQLHDEIVDEWKRCN